MLRGIAVERLPLKLSDRLPLRNRLGHRLAAELSELRLIVERFQVRRSARHVKKDDPLRPLTEVQRIDDAMPALVDATFGAFPISIRRQQTGIKQRRKRD